MNWETNFVETYQLDSSSPFCKSFGEKVAKMMVDGVDRAGQGSGGNGRGDQDPSAPIHFAFISDSFSLTLIINTQIKMDPRMMMQMQQMQNSGATQQQIQEFMMKAMQNGGGMPPSGGGGGAMPPNAMMGGPGGGGNETMAMLQGGMTMGDVNPRGYITSPRGSQSMWKELVKIFPEAQNHLYPDEIEAELTDAKFKAHIDKCTADMIADPPVPRPRCEGYVSQQIYFREEKQRKIEDNDEEIRVRRVSHIGALENVIKLSQEKLLKAETTLEKENEKLATCVETLDTNQKIVDDLTAGSGPDSSDVVEEATAAKVQADADNKAAKEFTKTQAAAKKEAANVKTAAKKEELLAKSNLKKAETELKKGKGDAAELQAAVDECQRLAAAASEAVAAAEQAEKDAKQAETDAKAAEKAAGEALKSATKAEQDAKKGASGAASALTKANAQVVRAETSITAQQKKVDKANNDVNGPKALIQEKKDKIAVIEGQIKEFEDDTDDCKTKITESFESVKKVCADARIEEQADILKTYQDARDMLIKDLRKHVKNIDCIEQLRKDRIATHGEKELEKRIAFALKIGQMKQAENVRRDGLTRTCLQCGAKCNGVNAANHHASAALAVGSGLCDSIFKWYAIGQQGQKPDVTFKADEDTSHLAICAPMLDSAVWNDVYKMKDHDLLLYAFQADIVTNPYDGWWAEFEGAYYSNFKKQDPKSGALIAREAWKALPESLKPKPPTRDMDIYDITGLSWNEQMRMYTRDKLQKGHAPKEGDRFTYLTRSHEWWANGKPSELLKEATGN